MKCIQCGINVPDSAAFCPNCGCRQRSAVFSPKPETFKFSCNVCGQHISVPKVWSGRLAVCPSCNQRVRIPRPDAVGGLHSAPHSASAEPVGSPVPAPPKLRRPVPPVPPQESSPAVDAVAGPEETADAGVIPAIPPAVLAAGKRRSLMAGAAGVGILLCLLAVLGAVGVQLYRKAAAARPADLELFRRLGVACTIYCVDFQGAFPAGEGAAGWRRLIDQECLERNLLLPEGAEFSERNLKIAYVGAGLREGAVECGQLPVAFDKPRFVRGGIRVLRCDGQISVVEYPGKERSSAAFAAFLRDSTPGPEEAWARILENARAIDFADGF